jgi:RimJ/RimL family protein N-acetyltransferase
LASAHRGRGIGPVAIRRATDFVRQEWDGVRVLAYVREPNEASRGVFLKAGFVVTAPDPQCPPGHVSFVST